MPDQEEWGPVVNHDGRGFPEELTVGMWVKLWGDRSDGRSGCGEGFITITDERALAWFWAVPELREQSLREYGNLARVLAYQVRRPKGLAILESLLQRQPEDA